MKMKFAESTYFYIDPLGTLPNAKQGNGFSPLSQYTDGRNLYEYCAGDPINERDMWGLVWDPYGGLGGGYTDDWSGGAYFPFAGAISYWATVNLTHKCPSSAKKISEVQIAEFYYDDGILRHASIIINGSKAWGLGRGDTRAKDDSFYLNHVPKRKLFPVYVLQTCECKSKNVNAIIDELIKSFDNNSKYDSLRYNCSSWAKERIELNKCLCTNYAAKDTTNPIEALLWLHHTIESLD
ncbi:MAG: hypothetical protein AB7F23_10190 [Phycisphaerae bacterium]